MGTFEWSQFPSVPVDVVPRTRHKHAACLLDDHLYVFGGKDGTLPLTDIWRLNLCKLLLSITGKCIDKPSQA